MKVYVVIKSMWNGTSYSADADEDVYIYDNKEDAERHAQFFRSYFDADAMVSVAEKEILNEY